MIVIIFIIFIIIIIIIAIIFINLIYYYYFNKVNYLLIQIVEIAISRALFEERGIVARYHCLFLL